MIIKVPQKTTKKVDCLYEAFGPGLHLIEEKGNKKRIVMAICDKFTDALFIHEDNTIGRLKSGNAQIPYPQFNEFFTYIKKLTEKEIIINVQGEKNELQKNAINT